MIESPQSYVPSSPSHTSRRGWGSNPLGSFNHSPISLHSKNKPTELVHISGGNLHCNSSTSFYHTPATGFTESADTEVNRLVAGLAAHERHSSHSPKQRHEPQFLRDLHFIQSPLHHQSFFSGSRRYILHHEILHASDTCTPQSSQSLFLFHSSLSPVESRRSVWMHSFSDPPTLEGRVPYIICAVVEVVGFWGSAPSATPPPAGDD